MAWEVGPPWLWTISGGRSPAGAGRTRGWRAGSRSRARSRPRRWGTRSRAGPRRRPGRPAPRWSARTGLELAAGDVEDDDRGLALGAGGGEGELGAARRERRGSRTRCRGGRGRGAPGAGVEQRRGVPRRARQRTQAIVPSARKAYVDAAEQPLRDGRSRPPRAVSCSTVLAASSGRGSTSRRGRRRSGAGPRGVPLGLEDRLVRAAGDRAGASPRSASGATQSSVPSQGMFGWSQQVQASHVAVGADPREGVEVAARGEHRRLAVAVERQRDDLVLRLRPVAVHARARRRRCGRRGSRGSRRSAARALARRLRA